MLSIISWLFLLPGAARIAIPLVAICNGVYNGDQALSAVLGLIVAAPGVLLVVIDSVRRGWRQARVGLWGIALLVMPTIAVFIDAGFCELTGLCGIR